MTLELLPGPWQKNQSAAQCARMFQTIVKPVYVCYILFIYLYIYSDSNQQIKLLKLIPSEFSVRGEPKSPLSSDFPSASALDRCPRHPLKSRASPLLPTGRTACNKIVSWYLPPPQILRYIREMIYWRYK